jgi:hypothetical protein
MAFNGGNPVADRLTNLPAHLPSLIGREEAITQVPSVFSTLSAAC